VAKVKLKSCKSASKRFKKTGSGGYKHRQSYRNHILTKKSGKRIRQLRRVKSVSGSDIASIRRMLPNT